MPNIEKDIIQGTVSVEFKAHSANVMLTPSADLLVKHGEKQYAVAFPADLKAGSGSTADILKCKLYILREHGATGPFTLNDSLKSVVACVATAQTKVELIVEGHRVISIRFPVK